MALRPRQRRTHKHFDDGEFEEMMDGELGS
jgi:hypothetical protein